MDAEKLISKLAAIDANIRANGYSYMDEGDALASLLETCAAQFMDIPRSPYAPAVPMRNAAFNGGITIEGEGVDLLVRNATGDESRFPKPPECDNGPGRHKVDMKGAPGHKGDAKEAPPHGGISGETESDRGRYKTGGLR